MPPETNESESLTAQQEYLQQLKEQMVQLTYSQGWRFMMRWAEKEVETLNHILATSENPTHIYRTQGRIEMLKRFVSLPESSIEVQEQRLQAAQDRAEKKDRPRKELVP